ncbi:NTPase [bacterium]|nr:NTPase [bacterium]
MEKKNIMISGLPGAGKTSLLKAILPHLSLSAGGFISEELREEGERVGFSLLTLEGKRGILAHKHRFTPHRFGKYYINLVDLEQIAVKSIEDAIQNKDIIIIDEIGKMELLSPLFRQIVIKALDSPKPVIATLHRANDPFLNSIRAREDTIVFWLTPNNREQIFQKILSLCSEK